MTNAFSLLNLFTGDIITIIISVILVIGSIISWAIIVEKIRLWYRQKRNPIQIKPGNDAGMTVDRLIRPFDKHLWFLSMLSYVAPFIGLFGTIWGVMDSFAAIGINQSVSIGVIAPGLAIALGTTALGLIAAIPAAIAYQYFTKKSDDLYNNLDDAYQEAKFSKLKNCKDK